MWVIMVEVPYEGMYEVYCDSLEETLRHVHSLLDYGGNEVSIRPACKVYTAEEFIQEFDNIKKLTAEEFIQEIENV